MNLTLVSAKEFPLESYFFNKFDERVNAVDFAKRWTQLRFFRGATRSYIFCGFEIDVLLVFNRVFVFVFVRWKSSTKEKKPISNVKPCYALFTPTLL